MEARGTSSSGLPNLRHRLWNVPAGPALASAMAQALTVLYVDDDHQVRETVAALLRAEGFRVLEASNAFEAMRVIANERVDVLFTDIVMPGRDGVELAKQAQQLRPDIRVIFATGYFSQARDAETVGKLLFKPIRAREMRSAFGEMLEEVH
jgi:DNA-binding NtrC family response regulator